MCSPKTPKPTAEQVKLQEEQTQALRRQEEALEGEQQRQREGEIEGERRKRRQGGSTVGLFGARSGFTTGGGSMFKPRG